MENTIHNISDEELEAICRAIFLRYGFDFAHYEATSLKRRLVRVLHKFNFSNTFELWAHLLKHYSFIYEVIDEITVGLTEMFRNPEMWRKLRDDILPTFKDKKTINIWHAGCSTGEEVYSMLITLAESNLLHKTNILATDLNSSFIQMAAQGVYSNENLKPYRLNYSVFNSFKSFADYYEIKDEKNFQMKPELKEKVRFINHNLVKDDLNETFDLIFCRNVMIYFDEVFKAKVLNLFHRNLDDAGKLVIGYYDGFPAQPKPLFMVFDGKNKIYSKVQY